MVWRNHAAPWLTSERKNICLLISSLEFKWTRSTVATHTPLKKFKISYCGCDFTFLSTIVTQMWSPDFNFFKSPDLLRKIISLVDHSITLLSISVCQGPFSQERLKMSNWNSNYILRSTFPWFLDKSYWKSYFYIYLKKRYGRLYPAY